MQSFSFLFSWFLLIVTFSAKTVKSQSPYPTKPIISFCAGSIHACAVFDNNMMKCWGVKRAFGLPFTLSFDALGDELTEVGDNIPYFNPGTSLSIAKVSCLGAGICVLLNTGDVKCAGSNSGGQAGIGVGDAQITASNGYVGDTLPVVNLGNGVVVTSIASGQFHNCVLVASTNKVKCFGYNSKGQLGYGDKADRGKSASDMGGSLPFVDLGTNVEIASVHSGSIAAHNCVILSAPVNAVQRVKCWGWNLAYQLGYGDTNDRGDNSGEMGDNLPVVDLGDESRVKQLIVGDSFTCALLINDVLKCYGETLNGKLPSGSTDPITSTGNTMPSILIDSGKIINLLTTGYTHTCIVYDDNLTMKCAGVNSDGQLGQSDTTTRGDSPTTTFPSIPAIDLGTESLNITFIGTGLGFTCVAFIDGSIKCFGKNDYGQLAIGSITTIGDAPGEMGINLQYAELFSPTSSPTKNPTLKPSKPPTTFKPTIDPTKKPTISPSKSPTNNPTLPTSSPTRVPTQTPINVPTTNPTDSPTKTLAVYLPPMADCQQYIDRTQCVAEINSQCGTCAFFSEKVRYGFRVRIDFVMDKGVRFIDFDNPNATPPKRAFKDAIKLIMNAELGGVNTISITRSGQIYQSIGSDSGYTLFDIYFDDSDSNRVKVRAFLTSKPDFYDYIDDLNRVLNVKMGTTGKNYITGKITINNLNIIDLAQGQGLCGCSERIGSSAIKMQLGAVVMVAVSILIAFLLS